MKLTIAMALPILDNQQSSNFIVTTHATCLVCHGVATDGKLIRLVCDEDVSKNLY